MAIDSKTEDFKSHKYKRNVYVEINPKTKEGQDLLMQYHRETNRQYIDIGRIGYHDEYGRYKIDYYIQKELKVVPKLIISVIKSAMNRAGKDVYKLRTYMSKFGQLNFLLTVDNSCSELILVENVYITNLNHREDYETPIWKINHYNENPVPLKQIFYEFGIKANPDDYGKSWKGDDVKINNLIVAKAKAELTISLANTLGNAISNKALVASLNNLNSAGEYGKKITKAYSEKVAKTADINKLASSPKLENTLNQVLIKTIDSRTDKKELKDKQNLEVYKNVVNIQFSALREVGSQVEQRATNSTLKEFMLKIYEKNDTKNRLKDEKIEFDISFNQFEKIIDSNFNKKPHLEKSELNEEKFDNAKFKSKTLPDEYRDFSNKKVEVNLDTNRFLQKEDAKSKKTREKQEKLEKIKQKKDAKLLNKKKSALKKVEINCNLDEELEKSKIKLGILLKSKTKNKEKKKATLKAQEKLEKKTKKKQDKKEILLKKIENKIKRQNLKLAEKREKKETKKKKLIEQKIKKEEKKKKKKELNNQSFYDSKKQKPKTNDETAFRPVVKSPEKMVEKNSNPNFSSIKQKTNMHNNLKANEYQFNSNAQKPTKEEIIQNVLNKIRASEYSSSNSYQTSKKTKEKNLEM